MRLHEGASLIMLKILLHHHAPPISVRTMRPFGHGNLIHDPKPCPCVVKNWRHILVFVIAECDKPYRVEPARQADEIKAPYSISSYRITC